MKPKYFIFLCLSVFILSTQYSLSTIRYVSKTGTSTPPYTSWQTAADSIQKCINICVAGDTIYVANGIYKENLVINTQIFLSGLSTDSTIIDGTGLAVITVEYLSGEGGEIKNFKIIGKGFNQGAAILTRRSILIKNCRITSDQTGLSVINTSVITENLIIDQVSKGIFAGCLNGDCYTVIKNSLILLNAPSSTALSINVGGTYYIDNNILLYNNDFETAGNGISCGWPKKVYIRNNLISGFLDNIFFDIIEDSAFIENNLITYKPDLNNTYGINTQNDNVIIKNNIFSNNKNSAIRGFLPYVDLNYNLFWQNENDLYGINYGDSDQVADPMFVKDTIPSSDGNYDFHLQAFSPGIDKGDPDILDKDGTRSDIGMYGGPFGKTYTYQDLAPLAPRNLSAVVDSNNITVRWRRNTEADTAYYKVYRDTVISFQIDSTKLVSASADTFFIQLPPYYSSKYVYKVTCVDNQGNESQPSQELIVNITSVSIEDYPMTISDYVLYQNYPNPFNPSTKIGYQLKERAYVKLMVYDIKGELVSVLVNKEQNAGYYEVDFSVGSLQSTVSNSIASGIYLYRIEVIGEGSIPVYTEMKKMLLLK